MALPAIIGLGMLAAVALIAFLRVEARAAEPILPLHVFRNSNFALVSGLSFLASLAMFGAITFLPLYQQTVQGASPTISGLLLTPMMVGVMITSLIAGQLTTRTGRYRALPILGTAAWCGMYLLSMFGVNTSRVTSGLFMAVLGLGMGFLMQTTTLLAQNSVEPRDIGVASSSRLFFQQIGGSIGVSAFGAIFARRLQEVLTAQGARRAPQHGRRPVQPGHGEGAARPVAARRVLRGHACDPGGVHLGAPGHAGRLRADLVHQGSPAPRPRGGRGASGTQLVA